MVDDEAERITMVQTLFLFSHAENHQVVMIPEMPEFSVKKIIILWAHNNGTNLW